MLVPSSDTDSVVVEVRIVVEVRHEHCTGWRHKTRERTLQRLNLVLVGGLPPRYVVCSVHNVGMRHKLWDTERTNCGRPYGLSYQDSKVLFISVPVRIEHGNSSIALYY